MLLTRLRRLSHDPDAGFAAVEDGAAGAEFAPSDSPPSEVEVEIIEGGPNLRALPVGAPETSRFSAFLDGIQQQRIAGFCGPVPIVWAYAAAVVRTRVAGRMQTGDGLRTRYQEEREGVFLPFRHVDPALFTRLGLDPEHLHDTNPRDPALPLFPPVLYAAAANEINHWREDLERTLAKRWCQDEGDGFLVVDGSLSIAPEVAACPRAVGVVKSHRTRYFDDADARVLLGLRAGERTSVFQPKTRDRARIYSWYLRVRPADGKDVFWGLVRVEAAASDITLRQADRISRWLLAESAPLSLPDPRWDRMIYPIRDCETYLRARAPGR